jgi:hypothetical protein
MASGYVNGYVTDDFYSDIVAGGNSIACRRVLEEATDDCQNGLEEGVGI